MCSLVFLILKNCVLRVLDYVRQNIAVVFETSHLISLRCELCFVRQLLSSVLLTHCVVPYCVMRTYYDSINIRVSNYVLFVSLFVITILSDAIILNAVK